jgi:hypothetical protein
VEFFIDFSSEFLEMSFVIGLGEAGPFQVFYGTFYGTNFIISSKITQISANQIARTRLSVPE